MQLEDKYKEYKLNFYHGKNEDFPSKLLRDIIEVSYASFVVSLKLFAIVLTGAFSAGKSFLWFREGKGYK
jgi:hypothetical protein